MKKVVRQTKESYVDVWPPLIDKGDIAWEVAIVLIAVTAAILGSTRVLTGFVITSIVLVVMIAMYLWTHARK